MAPGVVVIGSLPESNVEAGGERACRRFSDFRRYSPRAFQVAARGGDETCKIICRRLFQPLDADGERVPDKTVKAFQDLYKSDSPSSRGKHAGALSGATDSPIYPRGIFDRLSSKEWASLTKIQRTRGLLRSGECRRHSLAFAGPRPADHSRQPISHERGAQALYSLDNLFAAVFTARSTARIPCERRETLPGRAVAPAGAGRRWWAGGQGCGGTIRGRPRRLADWRMALRFHHGEAIFYFPGRDDGARLRVWFYYQCGCLRHNASRERRGRYSLRYLAGAGRGGQRDRVSSDARSA